MQPIIHYGHHAGLNPKKVVIILGELDIPYEINPNGRVPAVEDPNTGVALWESGAIIKYLVDKYDHKRKISFEPGTANIYHAEQWLHFQASGQGPYFGQAVWFKIHHKEQVQTAIDRYINEIRRVSGVLNGVLEGRIYLIDDKCSYADFVFVSWFEVVPWATGGEVDLEKDFPLNILTT